MASLNVCLEVSFLGECILAEGANEWPLPGVLLHVYLKSILLVEGLSADKTSEGSLASVDSEMSYQLAWLAELLLADPTNLFFALRPLTSFIDLSNQVTGDVLLHFNPMSGEKMGDSVLLSTEDPITPGTNVHLRRRQQS